MYTFEAHYTNMDTLAEREMTIHFDGQFLPGERAAYIYAMEKALDFCAPNECLCSLEFISC